MPFTSFSDLQTAIGTWLRNDEATDSIPDFITLFEAKIARKLNLRPTEITATLPLTSGVAALPADFLGMRRVTWLGSSARELDYVHPGLLKIYYPTSPQGMPNLYTLESGNILVMPINDSSSLGILYRGKTTALVTALNWLFTDYPDLYLYGSLAEAQGFNVDQSNLAMWKSLADEAWNEVAINDFNERTNMSMRSTGLTP